MASIWERFDKAFQDVEAWVIASPEDHTPTRIATASFKTTGRRSPSGLTVRCYLHLIGSPIVVGTAKGGGYDMKGAAFRDAIRKLAKHKPENTDEGATMWRLLERFKNVGDSGYWYQYVTGAGFVCMQAV